MTVFVGGVTKFGIRIAPNMSNGINCGKESHF